MAGRRREKRKSEWVDIGISGFLRSVCNIGVEKCVMEVCPEW